MNITQSSPKDDIIDNAVECIDSLQLQVTEYQQRNRVLMFIIAAFITINYIF